MDKDKRKKFGDKVRALRAEKKLSQTELAQVAKTTLKTVSRIELGLSYPNASTTYKLARALGVPVAELQEAEVSVVEEKPSQAASDISLLGVLKTMAQNAPKDEQEHCLLHEFRAIGPKAQALILAILCSGRRGEIYLTKLLADHSGDMNEKELEALRLIRSLVQEPS